MAENIYRKYKHLLDIRLNNTTALVFGIAILVFLVWFFLWK